MVNGPREIIAIVVAAGSGLRYGSPLPKQFCPMEAGHKWPVAGFTIGRLRSSLPAGARIALVLHPDYFDTWQSLSSAEGCPQPDIVVGGGSCRAESVYNALKTLQPSGEALVLVHDGVRPLVSSELVNPLVKAVEEGADGAVPGIPPTDSIRECIGGNNTVSRPRDIFRMMQTPQAFPAGTLVAAYDKAREIGFEKFTDDASVVERCIPGSRIEVTPGDPRNIKITHPMDISIAEMYMKAMPETC